MKADVIIIGAGAAGLMCAVEAAKRGRKVVVIEHSPKVAEKIRISGGGRCNFTNIHTSPSNFLSNNPHFCKSALKQYTQHDFIERVEQEGINFHEKTLGQLFCDRSANDIINMFLRDCEEYEVEILTSTKVISVEKKKSFVVKMDEGEIEAESVVVATGGLSIPKIGATSFGYDLARQFGLQVTPLRAGLVPLVFDPIILDLTKELSGISVQEAEITSESGKVFKEGLLFTHRGVSGPSVLQISSYWQTGENIFINQVPHVTLEWLKQVRKSSAKLALGKILSEFLPKRLLQFLLGDEKLSRNIANFSDEELKSVHEKLCRWTVKPSGSEGYRTAEVTLGGVDTGGLSSKTMEAKNVAGLYFIGEVVDVTGHLGGFNFQWAWSSGWSAGQVV